MTKPLDATLAAYGVSGPDFFEFHGLAIWPVRDEFKGQDGDGTNFVQCAEDEAEYFGLYGVLEDGTCRHLYDFEDIWDAFRNAAALLPYHFGLCRKGIRIYRY